MQNRTIGILAHVDAGKTTLSEQILYQTGAVRALGRVDHGDTTLDADAIERARGITVFSDQAAFVHHGHAYTLIDTPGHVDFAAEAERALDALDAAVLLLDASDGVKLHAVQLARMARAKGVPLIVFLNKCDLVSADVHRTLNQAKERLETELVPMPADPEQVAGLDEAFLESYLEGNASSEDCNHALSRAFLKGDAVPVLQGSALMGQGVAELLDTLDILLENKEEGNADAPLRADVYKIRRDAKGNRVTYVHLHSGTISPRDSFVFSNGTEKVHEIRIYQGERYTLSDRARPGDAVGLVGLTVPKCGDRLEEIDGVRTLCKGEGYSTRPALAARVNAEDGTPDTILLEKLRILEDEDGQLGVTFHPTNREILIQIMGPVQLEILQELLKVRFGIRARFSPPSVLYKETIAEPVMGYGHYEPLRHYAEVNLRLEPAPRGSGIAFASECHVDDLALDHQNLIRTHVFERTYRGVCIGADLTDVRIVLVAGRAHLKHTEGGDFREATCRAIRQGLMQAKSVILEPYYRFEILAPNAYAGKIMAEIRNRAGSFEPMETLGEDVRIRGRGPASTFADYGLILRSMTHGEGSGIFEMEGYDLCHNAEEVIARTGYDAGADTDQPACSVFCSHGAGYVVPWEEAESHMHCLKK